MLPFFTSQPSLPSTSSPDSNSKCVTAESIILITDPPGRSALCLCKHQADLSSRSLSDPGAIKPNVSGPGAPSSLPGASTQSCCCPPAAQNPLARSDPSSPQSSILNFPNIQHPPPSPRCKRTPLCPTQQHHREQIFQIIPSFGGGQNHFHASLKSPLAWTAPILSPSAQRPQLSLVFATGLLPSAPPGATPKLLVGLQTFHKHPAKPQALSHVPESRTWPSFNPIAFISHIMFCTLSPQL